jgi:hypothetical protein
VLVALFQSFDQAIVSIIASFFGGPNVGAPITLCTVGIGEPSAIHCGAVVEVARGKVIVTMPGIVNCGAAPINAVVALSCNDARNELTARLLKPKSISAM